jgi:hypothetical protein
MSVNKTDFVPKIQASRILGVAIRSVDPICKKNRVKVWQLPGHTRKLYSKSDLLNLIYMADIGAEASAVFV